MEIRYRWYKLRIPRGLDLEKKLTNYRPSLEYQHTIYHYSDDFNKNKYQFMSKKIIAFDMLDKDGNPRIGQVEAMESTVFALVKSGRNHFIRLENPSRNVRELMTLLERIVGLGFAVKPVVFSNLSSGIIFNNAVEKRIAKLKISNAVIGRDVVSQMEFKSSAGLVLDQIKILKGLSYKVDGVIYDLFMQGLSGRLSISSAGSVRIGGRLRPKILELLEAELPE